MFTELYQRVVEAAPQAMILLDGGGRVVLANTAAAELFGYAPDQILGGRANHLLAIEAPDGRRPVPDAVLHEPRPRTLGQAANLRAVTRFGELIPVEVSLRPIDATGGPYTLASLVDITERGGAELAASPADEPAEGPIDEGIFSQVAVLMASANDPDALIGVLRLFLGTAAQRVREVERAREQGDAPMMQRAAHTLKSSAATIGALSLSRACAALELKARSGQIGEEVAGEIANLHDCLEEVHGALTERFPALGAR